MKIIALNGQFGLAVGYPPSRDEEHDMLIAKEKCGFAWKAGTLCGDVAAVDLLKNHKFLLRLNLTITEQARESYVAAGRKILSAVEMSHAQTSDMVIPVPAGLELLPFQRAGISYALAVFARLK